jgi:hypothetical protein
LKTFLGPTGGPVYAQSCTHNTGTTKHSQVSHKILATAPPPPPVLTLRWGPQAAAQTAKALNRTCFRTSSHEVTSRELAFSAKGRCSYFDLIKAPICLKKPEVPHTTDQVNRGWARKKRLLSVLPVSKQRNATCSILMRNEVNIFAEIISTECNKRSSARLLFSSLCGVLRPGHSSLTQQGTQKRASKYAVICHLLSIY